MEEKENTENTGMGKRKHSHDTKIVIKYYYERIRQNTGNFLKWMGLSVLTGLVVGGASAVFAGCIKAATEYRDTHNWIFMLLPVAAICRRLPCLALWRSWAYSALRAVQS